ncbi:MAG: hypothetical protein KC713_04000 [Candidatus Omnitrophica bacterium]|nr:hypothetical protein [Candidatus Omnitrophota bacterium]
MLKPPFNKLLSSIAFYVLVGVFTCSFPKFLHAQVVLNILAVNGTDEAREKEIKSFLPEGLKKEDILDTSGLSVDYDINEGAYFVHGNVSLNGRETREFKVRVRDIWQINYDDVSQVKNQIDEGFQLVENTEYEDIGKIKKDALNKRLSDVVERQENHADNIERRIDRYRLFSSELSEIRSNAVSVSYWRSKPPSSEDSGVLKYVIQIENPSDLEPRDVKPKHYLPKEVKPEHITDFQGFDMRYDARKGQSFLTQEIQLAPSEKKRFEIEIIDVWKIPQIDIDNLRDRARNAFEQLEGTEYERSAIYLVASIKENLDAIEASQAIEKNIKEHISDYRVNKKRYDGARDDVESLESLLKVVKEELERSRLKNVLQQITSLQSVSDIAEAIFGTKPTQKNIWKWIFWILVFVGIYTIFHFIFWSSQSRLKKVELNEEDNEGQEKNKEEASV